MENLLRRVYINGDPEKLPKESGEYLVISSFGDDQGRSPYERLFDVNSPAAKRFWLKWIEWYEVPVSREEIIEMVNAKFENHYEEIEPALTLSEKNMLHKEWNEIAVKIADEIMGR